MQLSDTGVWNLSPVQALKAFTKAYISKGLESEEALMVGLHIFLKDSWALDQFSCGEDIKTFVEQMAEESGSYAGYEYVEEELLDPDDFEFESSDTGLAWVPYKDLYELLKEAISNAESIKTIRDEYKPAFKKMKEYIIDDVGLFKSTLDVENVPTLHEDYDMDLLVYIKADLEKLSDYLDSAGQQTAREYIYVVKEIVRKLMVKEESK